MKAVVFDFDGTLAELTIDFGIMKRGIEALAESFMGEEPETSDKPALERLDELAEEIAEYEGEELAKEFHTRGRFLILTQEMDAARKASLFPATRDILARLRGQGVRTAIITRNSRSVVGRVFPDWAEHVDALFAREDVSAAKPDPAHMAAALAALGVSAAETVLVGDHLLDLETARRAGTGFVAVATGRLNADALKNGGAEAVAPGLPEVPGLLGLPDLPDLPDLKD